MTALNVAQGIAVLTAHLDRDADVVLHLWDEEPDESRDGILWLSELFLRELAHVSGLAPHELLRNYGTAAAITGD